MVLPKGRYAPEFVGLPLDAPTPQGLAVLNVCNDTGRDDLDLPCQSLALRLTDSLAQLGVPWVIARESVTLAQGQANDSRSIGRALGVEWLLDTLLANEGDDDLRATSWLLSAIDGGVQWIETRAAPVANRLALFDALADRVFARFPATLKGDASKPDQVDLAGLTEDERHALELARMFCCQRAVTDLEQLTPEIDAVTRRHPACATAWGLLASTCFTRWVGTSPRAPPRNGRWPSIPTRPTPRWCWAVSWVRTMSTPRPRWRSFAACFAGRHIAPRRATISPLCSVTPDTSMRR
jgi:TolB-like protein